MVQRKLRNILLHKEASYTISPKSNAQNPRHCDWWIYKERHLIGMLLNKIKHSGRVLTLYDSLRLSFLLLLILIPFLFCANSI